MDSEAQVKNASNKKIKVCLWIVGVCIILGIGCAIYITFAQRDELNNDKLNGEISENGNATPSASTVKPMNWADNAEIQLLRQYLRFETVTLQGNFGPCVEFLKKQAYDLNLTVNVLHLVNEENPTVVMTWGGSQPELPSIMLNSHMDVVPAAAEYWHHPPFAAEIDENGNIYGRGTQDMKSVAMQYLAAIRALKRRGVAQLRRTIHLTFVPDEEADGIYGMAALLESDFFKKMNIGFGMDEGYPSETSNLEVYYAEKPYWSVNITAHGHSGHGSILFKNTAFEKLNYIINKFMEWRANETSKWEDQHYPYGNVTSINLTILKGGMQGNVVPAEMNAYFDVRLGIDADWEEYDRKIDRWVKEAGGNVTVEITKGLKSVPTPVDDSNPYWLAFKKATDELHLNVRPSVFNAATDSRYVRALHIPALGFSPLMNTPPLLHEHNEYINADVYLNGITIYEKIIESIANIE